MSFITSLTYYRHCEPPLVTADDLAGFISKLAQLELLKHDYSGSSYQNLSVKFGDSIDQNQKRTAIAREVGSGVFVHEEIDWDLEIYNPKSLQDITELLKGDTRRIYRAEASLGVPISKMLKPITRIDSPENEIDFRPDSLSVEIGPVKIGNLDSEHEFVGWIGVSLAGPGYLFPWTEEEVKDRLARNAEIQRVVDVCRSYWPTSQQSSKGSIKHRIKNVLPFKKFGQPRDWYWGVQEG